ncbi:Fc.00g092320.m01.CDS01 [Cosmosporella sp. VM-42]
MTSRAAVLSPATPSELLSYIISYQKHPTTLIIGCYKQDFISTLINDVKQQLHELDPSHDTQPTDAEPGGIQHPFLKAPLYQLAVSRHIRIIFTPTVTHLRAYLSVFSASDSNIKAPPIHKPSSHKPLLLIYGLLELHRGASEWSAQGIANSTAIFVESAVRNAFRPVIVEPKGAGGHEDFDQVLGEMVPLINGTSRKDDGSWSGRTVKIKRILSRWFEFESREWETN